MKKGMKVVLILSVLLLISYAVLCLYISIKVNKILKVSYDFYGENNIYTEDISDKNFSLLCYRNKEHREYNEIYEENWRSFPITIVWLDNARSWYWYDYSSAFVKGKTDSPIVVSLQLKEFRWVITDLKFNS